MSCVELWRHNRMVCRGIGQAFFQWHTSCISALWSVASPLSGRPYQCFPTKLRHPPCPSLQHQQSSNGPVFLELRPMCVLARISVSTIAVERNAKVGFASWAPGHAYQEGQREAQAARPICSADGQVGWDGLTWPNLTGNFSLLDERTELLLAHDRPS